MAPSSSDPLDFDCKSKIGDREYSTLGRYNMHMGYSYVIKCSDNSYYVGSTRNIIKRLREHKNGKVKYTKSRLAITLIFVKKFDSYKEAFQFEQKVKSWKKRKSIERMLEKPDNIVNEYI